jgi:hypothetical protein
VLFAGPIHGAKCPVLLPQLGVIHGLPLLPLVFASLCPAGIRDIAALNTLQLLAIDIGNRFQISSLTPFEIPRRDFYVMRRGFHSLSLELLLLGSGAPIFLLSLTL